MMDDRRTTGKPIGTPSKRPATKPTAKPAGKPTGRAAGSVKKPTAKRKAQIIVGRLAKLLLQTPKTALIAAVFILAAIIIAIALIAGGGKGGGKDETTTEGDVTNYAYGGGFAAEIETTEPSAEYVVRTSDGTALNMRGGAGKDFDIVGKIPDGTEITVLEKDGNWARVEYDDVEGWVSLNFTVEKDNTDDSDKQQISSSVKTVSSEFLGILDNAVQPTDLSDDTQVVKLFAVEGQGLYVYAYKLDGEFMLLLRLGEKYAIYGSVKIDLSRYVPTAYCADFDGDGGMEVICKLMQALEEGVYEEYLMIFEPDNNGFFTNAVIDDKPLFKQMNSAVTVKQQGSGQYIVSAGGAPMLLTAVTPWQNCKYKIDGASIVLSTTVCFGITSGGDLALDLQRADEHYANTVFGKNCSEYLYLDGLFNVTASYKDGALVYTGISLEKQS